jgi:hypothetical protein
MINMFKIIDDTFINIWNRVHNTHASAAWITQIQTQLSEAVPAYFECTEVQEIQIRITQQWLRSQAWQLSVCQGLVSSVSNDIPLTFKYPIEIARDLLTISHQFSQQAMEIHGVGLVSTFPFFAPSAPIWRLSPSEPLHLSLEQSLLYFDRTSAALGNVYL